MAEALSDGRFRPGNLAALKHGGQSPRIVAERTGAIVAELLDQEVGLQLTHPVDRHAVWATAAAMARLEELTAYLEGRDERGNIRGALDSRGRPRGAMKLYFTAYRSVMDGLRQLGATPSGRSDMASGIAALSAARSAAAHRAHRELLALGQEEASA